VHCPHLLLSAVLLAHATVPLLVGAQHTPLLIDISHLHGAQQQTRRMPLSSYRCSAVSLTLLHILCKQHPT